MAVWKHRPIDRLIAEAGQHLQRGDLTKAALIWRTIVERRPDDPEALTSLGALRALQGNTDSAVRLLSRAVEIRPGFAGAHFNLGLALRRSGDRPGAVAALKRAIELDSKMASAFGELGRMLEDDNDGPAAIEAFERAAALDPAAWLAELVYCQRRFGDWRNIDERTHELLDRLNGSGRPIGPLCLNFTDDPALQNRNADAYFKRHLARHGRSATEREAKPRAGQKAERDKIKIAYLSNDFREHPAAHLTAEMIELHDRSRFEVVGFSYGPDDGGPMRARMQGAFDTFLDVRRDSSAAIAAAIRKHRVDILVDMAGYSKGARLDVLADRPAPVQVHYLGYPGPLMCPWIDYLIADSFVVPPDHRSAYGDTFCFLPNCYIVNDRKRAVAAKQPSREECALPGDAFVLCAFHNFFKITPDMFERWLSIMERAPGTVLWLLDVEAGLRDRLRATAGARGIAADKLVFAPRRSVEEHLARLPLADLFLDTLPYNAHTTASEALWMGVPVLTCPGRAFASRVAGSVLQAMALPELVIASLDDYVGKAVEIAANPALSEKLRKKVAANRNTHPLFDTRRFCTNLESAYEEMWRRWREGETPRDLNVAEA